MFGRLGVLNAVSTFDTLSQLTMALSGHNPTTSPERPVFGHFSRLNNILFTWLHHILFIHSPTDEYLDYFFIGVIMNNADMNIPIQVLHM